MWDFNFTTKRIGAANGDPQAGPASAVGTAISAYLGDRESRGILIVLVPPIALRQSSSGICVGCIADEIGHTLREIDRNPIRSGGYRLRDRPDWVHRRNQEQDHRHD